MQTIDKKLIRCDELRKHIAHLASLQADGGLFISCYLDLSTTADHPRHQLAELMIQHKKDLQGSRRIAFDDAARVIDFQLNADLDPAARGLALFARNDVQGYCFTGLQLAVAVNSQLSIASTPDLFPLMEVLDDYERFKLLRVSQRQVDLFEIDLGVVSRCATLKLDLMPPREAEHSHRLAANPLAMACQQIDKLLRLNHRDYFIISADPGIAHDIVRHLPAMTQGRFIDVIPDTDIHGDDDLFAQAIATFSRFEEQQSRDIASRIAHLVHSNGLAVAGPVASLAALQNGIVDTLVLVKNYPPSTGWACQDCDYKLMHSAIPECCSACGSSRVSKFDFRTMLVRLAGQQGVAVEVVESEDELEFLGGVGCLLGTSVDNSRPLSLVAA